jgi:hypothetical protein
MPETRDRMRNDPAAPPGIRLGSGLSQGARRRQFAPTTDLPVSPGHPFYTRLNRILDDAGFDRRIIRREEQTGSGSLDPDVRRA